VVIRVEAGDRCAATAFAPVGVEQLFRYLAEEARRRIVGDAAEQRAPGRIGQVEFLFRPRDAHVAEAAFLFQFAVALHRAQVRKDALLQPDQEHDRELQSLRGVQRHHRDGVGGGVERVNIGDERDLFQEGGERRRIGLRLELFGHREQFLDVFEPCLRLDALLLFQRALVARAVEDALRQFRDGAVFPLGAQGGDERGEVGESGARAGLYLADRGDVLQDVPERPARQVHLLFQRGQRRRADAARRDVQDTAQADAVGGVLDDAQIGYDVLNFLSVVEPHAPDEFEGRTPGSEHLFQDARLRVRAIEEGEIAPFVPPRLHLLAYLLHDPDGLFLLVLRLAQHERNAVRVLRPELLIFAPPVVSHNAVGRFEDRLGGAVVLFQFEDFRIGVVVFKLQNQCDIGPTKSIDRLVIVTDYAYISIF